MSYVSPVAARKLEGPDRAHDAVVGLIILVAELMIGFLAGTALYELGVSTSARGDQVDFGFGLAVLGGGGIVILTTLVYLVRVAVGRRSWSAPLWGVILMSVALVAGWLNMIGA